MAPISPPSDLALSSLELDSRSSLTRFDLPSYLSSLSLPEREALNKPPSSSSITNSLFKRSSLPTSPLDTASALLARSATTSTTTPNPAAGSISPDAINNKGIQALFALIGASFVIGAIWFFFWAKNGGFHFRRGDWDDYKSTVLRRKGPDGKTLSNATKSTKLGGGSVVGRQYRDFEGDDESSLGMSEIAKTMTSETGLTGGSRAMGAGKRIKRMRERMAEKKAKKSAAANVRKSQSQPQHDKATRPRGGGGGGGGTADDDFRAYKKEKAARVGGLNKESDGQGTLFYGTEYSETDSHYSTPNHNHTTTTNNHQRNTSGHRETTTPKRYSGSTPQRSRQPSPEKRQQRQTSTNDFAYRSSPRQSSSRQASPVKGAGASAGRSMPGSFADPLDMNSDFGGGSTESGGTKSYHHPIPGLSAGAAKGGNGGGYRRGRRDSLDSD